MSVSHFRFGAVALKSRSMRSSWTGGPALSPERRRRWITERMTFSEHNRQIRRSLATGPGPALIPSAMNRYPKAGSSPVMVEGSVDQVSFFPVPGRDGAGGPLVVGLSGEIQYPAGHCHRNPDRGVPGSQLSDQRVHHFLD